MKPINTSASEIKGLSEAHRANLTKLNYILYLQYTNFIPRRIKMDNEKHLTNSKQVKGTVFTIIGVPLKVLKKVKDILLYIILALLSVVCTLFVGIYYFVLFLLTLLALIIVVFLYLLFI